MDDKQPEKSHVYSKCTLDSLRGRFNFVQSNALLQLLHGSVPYNKTSMDVLKPNADCQSEVFCVNRFFRNDYMPVTNTVTIKSS